jgi:ferrous iron transport protein B
MLPTSPRILLAGNPNCGKTSLFNALTGARQKVGNYPGVTVEKRSGRLVLADVVHELVDLPGTYSLASYSPEERVAEQELLTEGEDLVVVVADATNLKRALVLLAQLLHIPRRMVLCLNMFDEAQRSGQVLDLPLLRSLLGFPVVTTVGHKGGGVAELRAAMSESLASPVPSSRLVLGNTLEHTLTRIREVLSDAPLPSDHRNWWALRLLLSDPVFEERARNWGPVGSRLLAVVDTERKQLEHNSGLDIALLVTDCHFGFVDGLLKEVIKQRPRDDAREFSDRIDRFLVHPVIGGPLFLLIMYVIFWMTFTVGAYPMGWIESVFASLGDALSSLWPADSDSALRSLLVDGVVGGVGGVIVFLPNIVLLFAGLSLLEDTGYMARAAFIMDRVMHRFGLHGRSFVPMVTGFGCSIPGIMATRTIESRRDRLTTMFVLPLMSCGARLPIWMLLVPAFFQETWRAAALWGIYLFGILLALLLALLLRRTVLAGEDAPFVMELPPYRLPTARSALLRSLERSGLYLRKAGTTILAVSVVMWAITSYPKAPLVAQSAPAPQQTISATPLASGGKTSGEASSPETTNQAQAAADLRSSVAGRLGTALEPLLRPMGLDWKVGVGIVGAFAAKEVFVAQMGIVHSLGQVDEDSTSLRQALARDYTPAAGLGLMVFLLVATPCMATVAVMKRESGSWGWALGQFWVLTLLGYLLGVGTFQLARCFL